MTATSRKTSARTRRTQARPIAASRRAPRATNPRRRGGRNQKSGSAFIYFIIAVVAAVLLLNFLATREELEPTPAEEQLESAAAGPTAPSSDAPVQTEPTSESANQADDGGQPAADTEAGDQAAADPTASTDAPGTNGSGDTSDRSGTEPFSLTTGTQPAVTAQGEVSVYEYSATDAISVLPASHEEIVRHSYEPVSETDLTISGHPAEQITGLSPRDGSETSYLLIHLDNELLFVRGSDSFLEQVKTGISIP